MEANQKHQYHADITIVKAGTYTIYNLTNASDLMTGFNLKMHEVWSHAPHKQYDWPSALIICTTLNLSFIKTPPEEDFIQGRLFMKDQTNGAYYIEKHYPGQSWYPFGFDKTENFEIYQRSKGYTKIFTAVETISLKKSYYDCYEDNSMRVEDCINEFIAEQLDCVLPWAKYHGKIQGLEACSGKDKFTEFRNLSRYIGSKSLKNQLKLKGCFKPNCITRKWLTEYQEIWFPDNSGIYENSTVLIFEVPNTSKTIVRKEIRLADFSTFMVDFGSYLGLYLGASILSLSEIGLDFLKKLKNLF